MLDPAVHRFHDVLAVLGVMSIMGREFNLITVVALLTIAGYSLTDTVVVFDKVLENVSERGERHTYSALVNMLLNDALMREEREGVTEPTVARILQVGYEIFDGENPAASDA